MISYRLASLIIAILIIYQPAIAAELSENFGETYNTDISNVKEQNIASEDDKKIAAADKLMVIPVSVNFGSTNEIKNPNINLCDRENGNYCPISLKVERDNFSNYILNNYPDKREVISSNNDMKQKLNSNSADIDNNNPPENKIFKSTVTKSESIFEEITINNTVKKPSSFEDLNKEFAGINPADELSEIKYSQEELSPLLKRLKTVYLFTTLGSSIAEPRKIENAFVPGGNLYNNNATNDYYGYNNVVRNFLNPVSRVIKGTREDTTGPYMNYIGHPMFGFGISSFLYSSGASMKESLLVSILDNIMFEFIVEGSYVAPSGLDLLTTTGGCIVGALASKYIFKKPFQAIVKKADYLKKKYHFDYAPIVEPGYYGKGMRLGTRITFTH